MKNFDINKVKRDNLNRLLNEKGIRPVDLANLIGVTSVYVSQIRSGAANIGDITLKKLCEALNVDQQEFFKHSHLSDTNRTNVAIYENYHYKLIPKFRNQKEALELNQLLLELERKDPLKLDIIKNIVKGFLNKT